MTAKTLYEDSGWALKESTDTGFFITYWLTHHCQQNGLWHHRFDGDGSEALDRPCSKCGSICPAGLQGMYMMLDML